MPFKKKHFSYFLDFNILGGVTNIIVGKPTLITLIRTISNSCKSFVLRQCAIPIDRIKLHR